VGGDSRRIAWLGIAADFLLTALLTVFLLNVTESTGDAVPRPLVLAMLYGSPGVIALIGTWRREPLVVGAASVPLILGSFLSWAFVTLPFLIPAAILLVGSEGVGRPGSRSRAGKAAAVVAAAISGLLVVVAGWAVLSGFTRDTCTSGEGLTFCGTGLIATNGLLVAGVSLAAAILAAALATAIPRRRPTLDEHL
jgi:hypothetical protein